MTEWNSGDWSEDDENLDDVSIYDTLHLYPPYGEVSNDPTARVVIEEQENDD